MKQEIFKIKYSIDDIGSCKVRRGLSALKQELFKRNFTKKGFKSGLVAGHI